MNLFQNGTVHGMLLGMHKYLREYKQDDEAVIVNISSTAGTSGASMPVYVGTKHAIIGFVRSWGLASIYEETKVRVVGLCPGVTITPMITECKGKTLGDLYERITSSTLEKTSVQA